MGDGAFYSELAVDPTTTGTLYGIGNTVAKSTDDGRTWTGIGKDLPSPIALLVVPTTPTTIYIGTADGIFKSPDAGASWQASAIAGRTGFIAFNPQDLSMVYTG